MEILAGKHQMFNDMDSAKAHLEWLRSMKDRFFECRRDLKKITVHYTRIGTWIRSKSEGV